MKFPIRILGRSRYESLKMGSKGLSLMKRLANLFDPDGAEPKLLRTQAVASIAGQNPPRVLDIGANAGVWTRCLANRFPTSRVHAVEADPRTAAVLRRNIADCGNVEVHQLAVHAASGTLVFHSHKNPLLSSIIDLEDAQGATRRVEVEAITLDELVRTRMQGCPALIKIDTEGNDLQVLAGASATLADIRLRAIIMEFGFDESNQRQVPLQQLLDVMAGHGFRLRDVDLAGIYNDALYGNALFWRVGPA